MAPRTSAIRFPALAAALSLLPVLPPDAAAQRFADATAQAGIDFRHDGSPTPRKYLPETMGGGAAVLDADGDGWMDLYFVNGAALRFPHPEGLEPDKSDPRFWNRFYRNNGDGTYSDATAEYALQGRGYGMGAAVGDYDNDGDPDLVVTNAATGDVPAATLYRNEEGRRFADVTLAAGLRVRGWAAGAGFFDYDNDGDLDLLILRYMQWRFDVDYRCGLETSYGRAYCHPDLFAPATALLYRNNGDGTFADVSAVAGIADHPGKGLGAAFADYDGDGRLDFAAANDSFPLFLFRNRGDGSFSEEALLAGAAYDDDGAEFAGMGAAFDDLDDDGRPDLVVTTLSQERYALFYNAGGGAFDYSTGRSGLGAGTQLFSGWGIAVFDADLDGSKEIFFANGHVMDNIEQSQPHLRYLQPPLLFRREGRKFRDVSQSAGDLFREARAGRGAAAVDFDNDGRVDIVVSNLNGRAYLARNVSETANRRLALRLVGCQSNRGAIGAAVKVTQAGGKTQYRTVVRGGSYLSSRDPRVFFGLGENPEKIAVEVRWPSGRVQTIEDPALDRLRTIAEDPDCARAER